MYSFSFSIPVLWLMFLIISSLYFLIHLFISINSGVEFAPSSLWYLLLLVIPLHFGYTVFTIIKKNSLSKLNTTALLLGQFVGALIGFFTTDTSGVSPIPRAIITYLFCIMPLISLLFIKFVPIPFIPKNTSHIRRIIFVTSAVLTFLLHMAILFFVLHLSVLE